MNSAERRKFKKRLWDSYSPTGGQRHHRVKKNVVFVVPYPSATLEHELCKFLYAYLHRSGCAVEILFPQFLERIPEFIKGIDYKEGRDKVKRDYWTEAVENATGLRRDFVCGETGNVTEFEHDLKRAKKEKGQLYLSKQVTTYEIPKV